MIKPHRVFKKKDIHKIRATVEKTFKNENQKETCSKTNENKSKRKNRSKKEGQTCKNKFEKVHNKKRDRHTSYF